MNSQGVLIEESEGELLLPSAKELLAGLNCSTDYDNVSAAEINFSTPPEQPEEAMEHPCALGNTPIERKEDELCFFSSDDVFLGNEIQDRASRRRRHTTTGTYNEDELSQRAMSQGLMDTDPVNTYTQSFQLMKTRNIQEDIDEGNFTSRREKPKNKNIQLRLEEPTHGVFVRKCGFTTTRPLEWALALETFLREADEGYRWDYLCNGSDEFCECNVKIFHPNSTKKIVVEIKIITGGVQI